VLIKAGRELKLAIPFTRFKVPAIFILAFGIAIGKVKRKLGVIATEKNKLLE
jgi:hypoxanthine-guanine phosphoribosyltransferase